MRCGWASFDQCCTGGNWDALARSTPSIRWQAWHIVVNQKWFAGPGRWGKPVHMAFRLGGRDLMGPLIRLVSERLSSAVDRLNSLAKMVRNP